MYCPRCGTDARRGEPLCARCGYELPRKRGLKRPLLLTAAVAVLLGGLVFAASRLLGGGSVAEDPAALQQEPPASRSESAEASRQAPPSSSRSEAAAREETSPAEDPAPDDGAGQAAAAAEKGPDDVEITIPASLTQGAVVNQVDEEARAKGIKSVTRNVDGSVTMVMTRQAHQDMLAEMERSADESFQAIAASDDFPAIKKIERNSDLTQVSITVDRTLQDSGADELAGMAIVMQVGFYQVFRGNAAGSAQLEIRWIDQATSQVFDTAVHAL